MVKGLIADVLTLQLRQKNRQLELWRERNLPLIKDANTTIKVP